MKQGPLIIDGHGLTLADVSDVAACRRQVELSEPARQEMARSYAWVKQAAQMGTAVYGVNTGFGSLARVRIDPAHSATLSLNLIRSHAAGVGRSLPDSTVRAMMLLRANALAKGASGCRPLLVDTLLLMLNREVHPVVPEQGSCGSSGDLAPLAHLGLVMTQGDHGRARYGGEELSAADAMARADIGRLRLEAKDGLAITNGAQLTTAIAALSCEKATSLMIAAELAAAMSIEALRGATGAFHAGVHRLRPYAGAIATAANLRALMAGSSLTDSVPGKVQDAYSLRCTPQVLGAARDAICYVCAQVSVELNAATDNPLILLDEPTENKAFSAGMFHGEPVGIPMDVLKIAVAEIASISERRLYRLTTGSLSGRLPPALAHQDRPELGMMVPQTTAAALVSENKALGWPASMDSIPTCEDQEDHVAMSTTAARRAARVVDNSRRVVAIELLAASRALMFRRSEETGCTLGAGTGEALAAIQVALSELEPDCMPGESIECLAAWIDAGKHEHLSVNLIQAGR
jgi:histidine ammonia-lyase